MIRRLLSFLGWLALEAAEYGPARTSDACYRAANYCYRRRDRHDALERLRNL